MGFEPQTFRPTVRRANHCATGAGSHSSSWSSLTLYLCKLCIIKFSSVQNTWHKTHHRVTLGQTFNLTTTHATEPSQQSSPLLPPPPADWNNVPRRQCVKNSLIAKPTEEDRLLPLLSWFVSKSTPRASWSTFPVWQPENSLWCIDSVSFLLLPLPPCSFP